MARPRHGVAPIGILDRLGQHAHRIRRLGMLRGSRSGQRAPTLIDDLFVWALACGRCDMEWDTVDEKEEP